MCQARHSHSSCALNDKLYVIGGFVMENYSANFEKTNLGIECLDTAAFRSIPEATDSQWKLLDVNSEIISTRGNSLVAAISMTELLIVGGMSQNAT